jgi:uncharacterized membrane protein (DUF485 family)
MNDDVKAAREELVKRIKSMPAAELIAYESAAVSTNRFITILAVFCLFFMIAFPSLLTIVPGVILVYVMANISSGVDITIKEVRNQLEKFDK